MDKQPTDSKAKAMSQTVISPGQWAPHLDDPDPPEVMSPEASKAAAVKAKELMRKKGLLGR